MKVPLFLCLLSSQRQRLGRNSSKVLSFAPPSSQGSDLRSSFKWRSVEARALFSAFLHRLVCLGRTTPPPPPPPYHPVCLSVCLSVFLSCPAHYRVKTSPLPVIGRWLDRVKTPEQFQQQIFYLTLGICHNLNTQQLQICITKYAWWCAHSFIGGMQGTVSLNSKFKKGL